MSGLYHQGSVLDQSLDALTLCYSNTNPPEAVILGLGQGQSLEAQIGEFGWASRHSHAMPELLTALLAQVESADCLALKPAALTELFWILFSQKAWGQIRRLARNLPDAFLGALPHQIADLCILACYRQHREKVIAGKGAASVKADLESLRADLRQAFGTKADLHHRGYQAMQAHILGDWEGARAVLAGLDEATFIGAFQGISSVFLPSDLTQVAAPTLAECEVFPAAAEHVALISLDQGYFDKYGLLAAQIFAQSNPGQGLHFHAIGFDPRPTMADWDLPIALGVTLDRRDLSQFSSAQARGYYANARLLYAADYLRLYRHLFLVDADGGVTRSLLDLADEAQGVDLFLNARLLAPGRELTRLPWDAVVACAVYFSGSAGSHLFAEALGRYLQHAIDRAQQTGQRLWYSDQTALFYTWYDLRDRLKAARFPKPAFKQDGGWKMFTGSEERLRFMRKATEGGAALPG